MSQKSINATIQLNHGTENEWNNITIPIPEGMLAYAVDTKVFKLGDGTNTFDDLPVFFNASDASLMQNFYDTFPEISAELANRILVVNSTGDGFDVLEVTLADLITSEQLTTALGNKSNINHTHSTGDILGVKSAAIRDTGTSAGNVPLIGVDGKLPSSIVPAVVAGGIIPEDTISYLLLSQLATDAAVAIETPDGYADEFNTLDKFDTDNSIGYLHSNGALSVAAGGWDLDTVSSLNIRGYACAEHEGIIYIVGGINNTTSVYSNKLYKYNTNTRVLTEHDAPYTACASMTFTKHTGTGLYANRLYLYGGYDGSVALAQMWEYDPATDTWRQLSNGPLTRHSHCAVFDGETNQLFIYGGTNGSTAQTNIFSFSFNADAWDTSRTSGGILIARYQHSAVIYDRKIYVLGGLSGGTLNHVRIYDIATDTWDSGQDMPVANRLFSCDLLGSTIYVYGGFDGTNVYNKIWAYDIITNTWSEVTTTTSSRRAHNGCIVNGVFYSFWGVGVGFDTQINNVGIYTLLDNYDFRSSTLEADTNISTINLFVRCQYEGTLENMTFQVSRDNGNTWITMNMLLSKFSSDTMKILTGSTEFSSGSGTQAKWRIFGNNNLVLHGVRMQWG